MPTSQLRRSQSRLLAVERPNALGHTSTFTVLDAARAERPITGALMLEEVAHRLDELPILRQSLVEVPLGLDRPWWQDHPGFDLDYHLRYIAVPDPEDPFALTDLVARIHSRPLDRSRPLWELYLISGLSGGRMALLSKVHLAALGAAEGREINAGLVTTSPELMGDGLPTSWRPQRGPNWYEMAGTAWLNALFDPIRTMTLVPRRLNRIPGLSSFVNPALALLNNRTQRSIVVSDTSSLVPRTSFNRRVGPHRRWATAELELDRIAAIRRAAGVSTVDTLATICAGALRHWLVVNDELPKEPLQALVPLSVTDPDAIDGIAGVVISLETHRHLPEQRLASIHGEIGEAVVRHQAMPAAEIRGTGGGTPLVGMIASRLLERSPLADRLQPPFNTVITSVPGPDSECYALGAPVESIHPILGVVDGVGLHIGAMSVGDRLCLSLTSDRDAIPDLDELAARLDVELGLLEDAVGVSRLYAVPDAAPEPSEAGDDVGPELDDDAGRGEPIV